MSHIKILPPSVQGAGIRCAFGRGVHATASAMTCERQDLRACAEWPSPRLSHARTRVQVKGDRAPPSRSGGAWWLAHPRQSRW